MSWSGAGGREEAAALLGMARIGHLILHSSVDAVVAAGHRGQAQQEEEEEAEGRRLHRSSRSSRTSAHIKGRSWSAIPA